MRSWNASCPSGRRTKWRHRPRTAPYRGGTAARISRIVPRLGHQNSSASQLITQSAPCSVAASRAIRVTHAACSRVSPSSRRRRSTPVAFVASEDVGRAVDGAMVGREDEIDSALEVVADARLDDVRLVADEQGEDELHAPPRGRRARAASRRRRRSTRDVVSASSDPIRCSSWSSRRRTRITSASPSTAASAAKAASSIADVCANAGDRRLGGEDVAEPRVLARGGPARSRRGPRRRRSRSRRRSRRSPHRPHRGGRARGRRRRARRRRPRRSRTSGPRFPTRAPSARAVRPCGSGSAAPRAGTTLGAS